MTMVSLQDADEVKQENALDHSYPVAGADRENMLTRVEIAFVLDQCYQYLLYQ